VSKGHSRRYGAAAGIVFALVFLGSLVVAASFGKLPSEHSSGDQVLAYYTAHRDGIRIGALLLGLGLPFLVVLSSGIAAEMRRGGAENGWLPGFTLASGASFAVTLGLGAVALPVAGSFHTSTEDPRTAQALHDVAVALIAFSGYFGAAFAATIALFSFDAGNRRLWLAVFSVMTVLFQLAAPVGFVDATGAFSPYDGVITIVGAFELAAWLLALSLVLARGLRLQPPGVLAENAG
jgi:hypothetical protein